MERWHIENPDVNVTCSPSRNKASNYLLFTQLCFDDTGKITWINSDTPDHSSRHKHKTKSCYVINSGKLVFSKDHIGGHTGALDSMNVQPHNRVLLHHEEPLNSELVWV